MVIPYKTTYVGDDAFSYCENLTSITIPNTVTYIGDQAFCCENLESITILNPKCEIFDSYGTTSTEAIIYGYKNSTAQEYAEKYNMTFVEITDTEIILGDVNGDGMVDAVDATEILVEYANLSTGGSAMFSDNQKLAGDVNSDNMIDAVDATMILTFYAYLSTGGTESDMRIWLDM